MTVAMSAAQFEAPGRAQAWRRHLVALAVVATAILAMFRADLAKLADLWWTSTTFGHCLFIGPVIAWLVWQRRAEVAQLAPTAWWPGLGLVAGGGFVWLVGDAASVDLFTQLGLIVMLQGAVVTLLGPMVARALLFPLLYAFFLVPFGESMEGPLQTVTARMVMPMLHAVGVPASIDGVLITIPNGYFEVAEACSGAKFEIAMIAFGTLVANVCFVSWRRRGVFMAVALVVPILANALRAFGTIYAAHLTSVAAATGYDHIVYGWIFFGLVMAAVLAIGWRWFDRDPLAPWVNVARLQAIPRARIAPWAAALLAIAVAGVFPLWGSVVVARADPLPDHITLPEVPGWTRAPLSTRAPWVPYYPGADRFLIGRYMDGSGDAVDLGIAVFGGQHDGKELVSFGTGVLRQNDVWVRVEDVPDIAGGSAMRITAPGNVERIVATWYRVGDVLTANPSVVKLQTLKTKLLGGPQRAVAVHVSAEVLPGHDARVAIARFLAALGPVDALADRAAGAAAPPAPTASPGRTFQPVGS
ncbi:exosortase A [Hephaestia mangrovi]|uniref:exosortase A n=1 Tax=Hephaestia mangrovi TaxID=2873268 RepID=UPI001CA63D6B|nr:exosortase A [Hephaestia mangrovi]MBY8827086.1 exosortase A [Hephaestia mangrovi]